MGVPVTGRESSDLPATVAAAAPPAPAPPPGAVPGALALVLVPGFLMTLLPGGGLLVDVWRALRDVRRGAAGAGDLALELGSVILFLSLLGLFGCVMAAVFTQPGGDRRSQRRRRATAALATVVPAGTGCMTMLAAPFLAILGLFLPQDVLLACIPIVLFLAFRGSSRYALQKAREEPDTSKPALATRRARPRPAPAKAAGADAPKPAMRPNPKPRKQRRKRRRGASRARARRRALAAAAAAAAESSARPALLSVEPPKDVDWKATSCPYCAAPIAPADAVACPRCETVHHRDCWAEAERCTTYGCKS